MSKPIYKDNLLCLECYFPAVGLEAKSETQIDMLTWCENGHHVRIKIKGAVTETKLLEGVKSL